MKKIFLTILSLILTMGISYARGFDMYVPLEGDSIANDNLQHNVLKSLYRTTSKKYPACLNHSVFKTQVVHYPYDVVKKNGKYVKGYWKELWSVNSCGNVYQVPLTFYIGKRRTTFTMDFTD